MRDVTTGWPDYEQSRLEELGRYAMTFDEPEPAFDSVVELLCHICAVPFGGISIVDKDTVWLKARQGVELCSVARSVSFCTIAIESGDDLFLIPDTAADPRFQTHPLVKDAPNVRYYAATPLISQAGFAIGTLWVMDLKPHALDGKRLDLLRMVGSHVESLLDARYLSGSLKLYSRSGFLRQVRDRLNGAERERLAIGCVNIRGLRYLNDIYGYAAGDLAIEEVARHIRMWQDELADSPCKPLVAHLEGGNFSLLVAGAGARNAVSELVDSLRRCAVRLGDQPMQVITTVSLIDCPDDGPVAPALLDRAVLIAREAPNSGICVLHDGAVTQIGDDDRLAADLRAALAGKPEGGRLEVNFQPIFDVAMAELTGFETLLRWDHPSLGPLPPERFVPLAERIGAAYQLDLYAFTSMCQALEGWVAAGLAPPLMSVNIARATLLADSLGSALLSIAADHGIAPDGVELEISAAGLIESRAMIDRVEALRAAGFSIAIDDFGTGMSNLDSLNRLPFDTVKIDRQFVDGVAAAPKTAELCRLMVETAMALGVRLICIGAQAGEDAFWLADNGVRLIQGWHFAEALRDEDAESLIRQAAPKAAPSANSNVIVLHRWIREHRS